MLTATLILCKGSLDQNYKCNIIIHAYHVLHILLCVCFKGEKIARIKFLKYHDIASIYINMEPAGQILLRNLHDHSPFRQQEVTRAFRKKNHGDFLKFFRGTFKSQGISGVISGASSNSGVFQGFQGFQGSLATLICQESAIQLSS